MSDPMPCHVCGLTAFEWDSEMERRWCEGCGEYQSGKPIHPARIAFDTRQPAPSAEADRLAEAVAALPHYYPYVSYEVGDGPTVGMDVDSDGGWFLRADVEDILAAYQKSKESNRG